MVEGNRPQNLGEWSWDLTLGNEGSVCDVTYRGSKCHTTELSPHAELFPSCCLSRDMILLTGSMILVVHHDVFQGENDLTKFLQL